MVSGEVVPPSESFQSKYKILSEISDIMHDLVLYFSTDSQTTGKSATMLPPGE